MVYAIMALWKFSNGLLILGGSQLQDSRFNTDCQILRPKSISGGRKTMHCIEVECADEWNVNALDDISGTLNADGDRCGKRWDPVFSTLAVGAMAEVCGDQLVQKKYCGTDSMVEMEQLDIELHIITETTDDVQRPKLPCFTSNSIRIRYGIAFFPLWHRILRRLLTHESLRFALFVIVRYCFKTSLGEVLGIEE